MLILKQSITSPIFYLLLAKYAKLLMVNKIVQQTIFIKL